MEFGAPYEPKSSLYINDGTWYIKNGVLESYSGGDIDVVVVPEGVVTISNFSFKGRIGALYLPESLKSCSNTALSQCFVSDLYIPDSVISFCSTIKNMDSEGNPTNITTIHCSADTKIPLYLKVNENVAFDLRAKTFAEAAAFLKTDHPEKITRVYATIRKQPTMAELKAFPWPPKFVLAVAYSYKEYVKYTYDWIHKVINVVIGPHIDWPGFNEIKGVESLFIDDSDGESLNTFLRCSDTYMRKIFSEVSRVHVLGKRSDKDFARQVKDLLTKVGVFQRNVAFTYFDVSHTVRTVGDKRYFQDVPLSALKIYHDEISDDYLLGNSRLVIDELAIKVPEIHESEIQTRVNEIRGILKEWALEDKDFILDQVNKCIEEYRASLKEVKPKLNFDETRVFGKREETAKELKSETVDKLDWIIKSLNMSNHYKSLQDNLCEFEDHLSVQEPYDEGDLITVSGKIKYIKTVAKSCKFYLLNDKLKKIITSMKAMISNYVVDRIKSNVMETEEDLSVAFSFKIDELFEEAKYLEEVYKAFNDPDTYVYAQIILNLKSMISKFDKKHEQEYSQKFDSIISRQYETMLSREDRSLSKGLLELKTELDSFIEELKEKAPSYIGYAKTVNSLNGEEKKSSVVINIILSEIRDVSASGALGEEDRKSIKSEVDKVINYWRKAIEDGDIHFYDEPSSEDLQYPYFQRARVLGSDSMRLEISVMMDLLKIKDKVDTFIMDKDNYERIEKESSRLNASQEKKI